MAGLKVFFEILLLLALILELSICAQANAPSSQGLPPGKLIDIKNGTFNLDNLTVPLNTTVIWANHDTNPIKVVADDNSFDSGEIYPSGYEYRYIFLQPGVYGYHSKDSPSMHGQIVVANADGTLPKITKTSASSTQNNNTTQANQTAPQISRAAQSQKVIIGLMAKNIAFNASKITVPAGAQVTINFDNQDGGVPHNFALYQSSSSTNAIFKGEIITGPRKTAYSFTAPSKPGTYYFQCDIHPTQMNGQFIVQ
ncbi:MAG: cupredoxin domain-containing protein [Methanotrichaceae archaeon]